MDLAVRRGFMPVLAEMPLWTRILSFTDTLSTEALSMKSEDVEDEVSVGFCPLGKPSSLPKELFVELLLG
jgi:hypothetical protein